MKFLYFLAMTGIVFCLSGEVSWAKKKSQPAGGVGVSSPAVIYGTSQLASELNRIIQADNVNANVSVYVKSMQHGDSLYALNVNQPLTPASTLKIFTAEAALLFLGGNYRFSTQLLTDAKTIKNGILQGNLYVILSGDPTLTYDDLGNLLLSLKAQGVQAISGNVYIDNTAYDESFYGPGWEWKDRDYCYGAPISASIINQNCLSFKLTPAKVKGRPAQVTTSSKLFYPPIKNSVMTTTNRRGCSVRLSKDMSSGININGCMPMGKYAWGVSYVVTDIPDYNRTLFKSLLNQLAINVFGSVTFGTAPNHLSLVGSHNSKPLRVLVNEMLKKSDNVIAGAI
jgi:D-alanyl-D-alanine carboxypeptidase/D-alanyl-D-alanine-endopeptidase (penicillin-binding protein 4)